MCNVQKLPYTLIMFSKKVRWSLRRYLNSWFYTNPLEREKQRLLQWRLKDTTRLTYQAITQLPAEEEGL